MPGVQVDDEGVYTFSQSWLNTFMNCPEQARRDLVGELPRQETDATAIGTAMHSGIEAVLRGGSVADGEAAAKEELGRLVDLPHFRMVQAKTIPTMVKTMMRCYSIWVDNCLPGLGHPLYVEETFTVDGLAQGRARLKGTMDFVDDRHEIWDWKTSGRPYETWEKERWAIQPTAYALGLQQLLGQRLDPVHFNYAVCIKGGKQQYQLLSVQRTQKHMLWLEEQITSIIKLIEADLPVWPLRDQHALCSPKWCPVYSDCKGRFV